MRFAETNPGGVAMPDERVAALAESVAAMRRQCEDMLAQMKTIGERVSELASREAQLRALAEHESLLEPYDQQLDTMISRSESTAARVAEALEGAVLHVEPFPYAVVDHLLPTRLYKCLVRGIPPPELFSAKATGKEQLAVPFSLAPTYSRRAWRYMAETVVPTMIAPRVIEKFRPQIDEWITSNWPGVSPSSVDLHSSGGRVMLRRRGYTIEPHRDPKWGFITCILYLPRQEDSESWGTQIYSVDEDREADSAAPYWIDPRRCRLVEDVNFKPNRMLVFLNSRGAHGARIPPNAQPENLQRHIYQFRIGPTAEAIAMLKAKLPEERQPLWVGKALIDA